MDTAYLCRFVTAAVAALALGGAAVAAEPSKRDAPASADRPTVLLASASVETVPTVANGGETSGTDGVPKRKRTARVTTCRCGDQTAASQD